MSEKRNLGKNGEQVVTLAICHQSPAQNLFQLKGNGSGKYSPMIFASSPNQDENQAQDHDPWYCPWFIDLYKPGATGSVPPTDAEIDEFFDFDFSTL